MYSMNFVKYKKIEHELQKSLQHRVVKILILIYVNTFNLYF